VFRYVLAILSLKSVESETGCNIKLEDEGSRDIRSEYSRWQAGRMAIYIEPTDFYPLVIFLFVRPMFCFCIESLLLRVRICFAQCFVL
jgi:hypothetical protein